MQQLNDEDRAQQELLVCVEQSKVEREKQLGNEEPVLVVLLPQPLHREKSFAMCGGKDLRPAVGPGKTGIANDHHVQRNSDGDPAAKKDEKRESGCGARLKSI